MIEITADDVRNGLTELMQEEGPDFVYQTDDNDNCRYVRDGKPDCLGGRFLFRMGVPLARLNLADPLGGPDGPFGDENPTIGTLLNELTVEGVLTCDPWARKALVKMQGLQDQGYPWGVVVESALAVR